MVLRAGWVDLKKHAKICNAIFSYLLLLNIIDNLEFKVYTIIIITR